MGFSTSKEAKEKAGWFSRRNQTSGNHRKAREEREANQSTKSEMGRRRDWEAKRRAPEEQLRRLDERLGVGIGASKERARLQALIENRW